MEPDDFLRSEMAAPNERWRADRRGLVPASCRIGDAAKRTDWLDDIQTVDPGHFRETADGSVLWGDWSAENGNLTRDVSIRTALVSLDTAPAILHAISAIEDTLDYALPSADEPSEILGPGFPATGWVTSRDVSSAGDSRDSWAARVPATLIGPASWVIDRLALRPAFDGMSWSVPDDASHLALHSWSITERGSPGTHESGQHLLATPSFIERLGAETGMLLLREVVVRHWVDAGRYHPDRTNMRERAFLDLVGFGS